MMRVNAEDRAVRIAPARLLGIGEPVPSWAVGPAGLRFDALGWYPSLSRSVAPCEVIP